MASKTSKTSLATSPIATAGGPAVGPAPASNSSAGLRVERDAKVASVKSDIADLRGQLKGASKEERIDINEMIRSLGQEIKDVTKDYNKKIGTRKTLEGVTTTQKALGLTADELESVLTNKNKYSTLQEEYKPFTSQIKADPEREAAIKATAKKLKVDPTVLSNYYLSKGIEPLYTGAKKAEAERTESLKKEEEERLALQEQLKEYQQQIAALNKQRKQAPQQPVAPAVGGGFPAFIPPGLLQPTYSPFAPYTTIIDAGGGQGIMGGAPAQMSPAQMAQMQGINQGLYGGYGGYGGMQEPQSPDYSFPPTGFYGIMGGR